MLGLPLPLIGRSRLPPFTLSGTFATDMDGWQNEAGGGITWAWSSSGSRTSPGSLTNSGFGARRSLYYTVPGSISKGLSTSVSIWAKNAAFSAAMTLTAQVGAGSVVTLETKSVGSTYTQLSGSITNPAGDDITIKLTTDSYINQNVDDWSISGA